MGQAMRAMSYDRQANISNALSVLQFGGSEGLQWFRLDDGVMGGKSETNHVVDETSILHFQGTIDTNGGGFCSIRARLPCSTDKATPLTDSMEGIRLRYRGDGKTYKLLLSDGKASTGGPFSRSPSWQADIVTTETTNFQELVVPFTTLKPSFGGSAASRPGPDQLAQYRFDPKEIHEIGLMLSLKLSDGSANPKETFGEGIFPFSLHIKSIEPVYSAQ